MRHRSTIGAVIAQCLCAEIVFADGALDHLRRTDLNQYSLGAFYYVSSSPYEGVDNFNGIFPAPTEFTSDIVSDETFFLRDGDIGLRRTLSSGWDAGVVMSIQTLGYGSGQSDALVGMRRRNWTIQGGLTVGRQIGVFRVDAVAQTDILGEHNGEEYVLKIAKSFDRGSYYFLPQIDITYQSSDLVNHYFGVRPDEALPGRPTYRPGAAVTYSASLEWAWKWHRRWFVMAEAGVTRLPAEIRESPIVDKDFTYSLMLTLAYDAPAMVEMHSNREREKSSSMEVRLDAFFVNADSNLSLTPPASTVLLAVEPQFDIDDDSVSFPFDLLWRFGQFHRLEFGYFRLKQTGVYLLDAPISVGDVTFSAGDTLRSSFETTIYKIGYAFSLIHDAQKELSLFGGAHITDVIYRSATDSASVSATTTAFLPVVGAELSVNFSDEISLETQLQFFAMDFNKYSGNMLSMSVTGYYRWFDRVSIGAGYRFYKQDIDSGDEDFFGDYRFEYHGPVVSVRGRF